jgi:hypothetical protein
MTAYMQRLLWCITSLPVYLYRYTVATNVKKIISVYCEKSSQGNYSLPNHVGNLLLNG